MGTVFMDTDNKKDFSDCLTCYLVVLVVVRLRIIVCLTIVNTATSKKYFYSNIRMLRSLRTPERGTYEAMCLVIVPETTFTHQL